MVAETVWRVFECDEGAGTHSAALPPVPGEQYLGSENLGFPEAARISTLGVALSNVQGVAATLSSKSFISVSTPVHTYPGLSASHMHFMDDRTGSLLFFAPRSHISSLCPP